MSRTFSTSKLDERWDREWIKMITGHKMDVAFKHYNKPSIDQLRKVVEGVPGHGTGQNIQTKMQ